MTTRLMRKQTYRLAILPLALSLAAVCSGCGGGGDAVAPAGITADAPSPTPSVPSSALTPDPSASPSVGPATPTAKPPVDELPPDPELLRQAREAKDREKADPEHLIVCLNKDGTLAGIITKDPRPGQPAPTKEYKERGCAAGFEESVSEVDEP